MHLAFCQHSQLNDVLVLEPSGLMKLEDLVGEAGGGPCPNHNAHIAATSQCGYELLIINQSTKAKPGVFCQHITLANPDGTRAKPIVLWLSQRLLPALAE